MENPTFLFLYSVGNWTAPAWQGPQSNTFSIADSHQGREKGVAEAGKAAQHPQGPSPFPPGVFPARALTFLPPRISKRLCSSFTAMVERSIWRGPPRGSSLNTSTFSLSARTFSTVLLCLVLSGTGDLRAGRRRSVKLDLGALAHSHLCVRSFTEPFCRGKSGSSSVPCQCNIYLGSETGGPVLAEAPMGQLRTPCRSWDRPQHSPVPGRVATCQWKEKSQLPKNRCRKMPVPLYFLTCTTNPLKSCYTGFNNNKETKRNLTLSLFRDGKSITKNIHSKSS